MGRGDKKLNGAQQDAVRVSGAERELLREMVHSERVNLKVFNLPSKQQQSKYEKMLDGLAGKLA